MIASKGDEIAFVQAVTLAQIDKEAAEFGPFPTGAGNDDGRMPRRTAAMP